MLTHFLLIWLFFVCVRHPILLLLWARQSSSPRFESTRHWHAPFLLHFLPPASLPAAKLTNTVTPSFKLILFLEPHHQLPTSICIGNPRPGPQIHPSLAVAGAKNSTNLTAAWHYLHSFQNLDLLMIIWYYVLHLIYTVLPRRRSPLFLQLVTLDKRSLKLETSTPEYNGLLSDTLYISKTIISTLM